MATAANLITGRSGVRMVVIGYPGIGKSSLVFALATGQFPEELPAVMAPTRLPADYFPDGVSITIVDTSSSPEQKEKLIAEYKAADAVVPTYACDRPDTVERLGSFCLPELRRLELNAPVIVVGCKVDLRDDPQVNIDQVMEPIVRLFLARLRRALSVRLFAYSRCLRSSTMPTRQCYTQQLLFLIKGAMSEATLC